MNIYLTGTASSTFENAMGFSWSEVVGFTGENIKLIVGGGVGIFSTLVPWIIALVVISTLVMFIFTAFRFFQH